MSIKLTNEMLTDKDKLDLTLKVCQSWALILCVFGVIGNMTTIVAVIHEIILNQKSRQRRKFLRNQLICKSSKDLSPCESKSQRNVAMRTLSVSTCSTIASIMQGLTDMEPGENFPRVYRSYSVPPTKPLIDALNPNDYLQNSNDSLDAISEEDNPKNLGVNDGFDSNCEEGIKMPQTKMPLTVSLSDYLNGNANNQSLHFNSFNKQIPFEKINHLKQIGFMHSFEAAKAELRKKSTLSVKRKRTSLLKCDRGTIIILCLCITDFLFCAVNLPLTYYTYSFYYAEEEPPQTFCKFSGFIRYVIAYAEWMTVGFLFIERCLNLKKFNKVKLFSPLQTGLIIVLIWTMSIILQIAPFVTNRFAYDNRLLKCDYVCGGSKNPWEGKLYFFTLVTMIPCSLVLIGCVSIMIQIVQNKKNLIKNGMGKEIIEQRRRETHYSLGIVTGLMLLFFFCVTPISVSNAIYTIRNSNEDTKTDSKVALRELQIGIALYMVYWTQYAVNFIVYVAANPCFRVAYINLFTAVKKHLGFGPKKLRFGA